MEDGEWDQVAMGMDLTPMETATTDIVTRMALATLLMAVTETVFRLHLHTKSADLHGSDRIEMTDPIQGYLLVLHQQNMHLMMDKVAQMDIDLAHETWTLGDPHDPDLLVDRLWTHISPATVAVMAEDETIDLHVKGTTDRLTETEKIVIREIETIDLANEDETITDIMTEIVIATG